MPSSQYTAVFYLFGKADVAPFYAIHDEDALEFPYTLQAGNGPERMFSQLRSRNLLLIGCNFADWLSRFFIRLSNLGAAVFRSAHQEGISSWARRTCEDQELTVFLERFSQDSRCYPTRRARVRRRTVPALDASGTRRRVTEPADAAPAARAIRPPAARSSSATPATTSGRPRRCSRTAEDRRRRGVVRQERAEAGRRMGTADPASAIQRCSLFLPLLSANTERRTEGYFRLEWNEAAERSKRIQGRKFIFPIVIDPDYTGDMSRYALRAGAIQGVPVQPCAGGRR